MTGVRLDFPILAKMIEPGARVLDVGCGGGDLLYFLQRERNIDGRGMELSQAGVNSSVSRGLSVVQGDADSDLVDYPSNAFDVVILSQSLQVLRFPRLVLEQMLRIGHRAIVSFPNFGFWKVRLDLAIRGRMPLTTDLPLPWYETPNIHLCTILDFTTLCGEMDLQIQCGLTLDRNGRTKPISSAPIMANLFGEQGIFCLKKITNGRD